MIRVVILRILDSFFRRWWLHLLPILLFTILGLIYYFIKPPLFVSKGVLLVNKTTVLNQLTNIGSEGAVFVTPAQSTIDQLSELANTDSFIRAIIAQTSLENELQQDPESLKDLMDAVRQSIWAEAQGEQSVGIYGSWEDANIGLQLVNATVENFLQWHINRTKEDSAIALNFFNTLVGEYKQQLDGTRGKLDGYLVAHPEPIRGERPEIEKAQIKGLEGDIDISYRQYVDALGKQENARLSTDKAESSVRQTYVLIDTPTLAEKPIASKLDNIVSIAIFVVLGMIFAILSVVGGAAVDRSFRFPVDVQQFLNIPVLAVVPTSEQVQIQASANVRMAPIVEEEYVESEPELHQARLIPLVEPPTLIIMPNEKTRAQPILSERKRYEQSTDRSQERNRSYGITDSHLGTYPTTDDLSAPPSRSGSSGKVTPR